MEERKTDRAFDLFLNNFRSFKSDTFKFSKINILIGENSSGKSSLFKFFLALKQTLEHPNNKETNLAFSGEYADLGSFKESIYYHDDNLPLEFSFTFGSNYYKFFERFFDFGENQEEEIIKIREFIGGPIYKPLKISYLLNKNLDKHQSISTNISCDAIGNLTIEHKNRELVKSAVYGGSQCKIIYRDYVSNEEFILDNISFEKDGFNTLIEGSSLHTALRGEFDANDEVFTKDKIEKEEKIKKAKVESYFYKIGFLLISQNFLDDYLDNMDYINPIDSHPSRVYYDKDKKFNPSIKNLEDVVNFIGINDDESKAILKYFTRAVKSFGIADDIKIIQDDRLPVRELRVKVKDLLSNITDVGYGVSLQLPLILKAVLAEKQEYRHNSILLIEQPEVHLHPMLHANLIETLASLSEHTTYFIETHSEHIIRKLQVLIKEGKYGLTPDDVSIHYFKRIKKKSQVTHHRIDSFGMLEPQFPTGFFDNSYLLSKELLD